MPLAPRTIPERARSQLGPTVLAATCWLAGCVSTAAIESSRAAPLPATLGSETAPAGSETEAALADLEVGAARLLVEVERIELRYARDIAPVATILAASPFADDENLDLRRRIALALHREAHAHGLSAELLASMLVVENPWLDLDRRSPVGAVGLMQVMPLHAGEWGCASNELEDVEANICHGVRIFARDLKRSRGDVDRALLRYNGCVRGANTADCRRYPTKVYAQAGRAQLLGGASPSPQR